MWKTYDMLMESVMFKNFTIFQKFENISIIKSTFLKTYKKYINYFIYFSLCCNADINTAKKEVIDNMNTFLKNYRYIKKHDIIDYIFSLSTNNGTKVPFYLENVFDKYDNIAPSKNLYYVILKKLEISNKKIKKILNLKRSEYFEIKKTFDINRFTLKIISPKFIDYNEIDFSSLQSVSLLKKRNLFILIGIIFVALLVLTPLIAFIVLFVVSSYIKAPAYPNICAPGILCYGLNYECIESNNIVFSSKEDNNSVLYTYKSEPEEYQLVCKQEYGLIYLNFDNLILDFTMADDTIPETTLISSKTNYYITFDILIGESNEQGELSIYYNGSPAEILIIVKSQSYLDLAYYVAPND